jgi:hypothetical protein
MREPKCALNLPIVIGPGPSGIGPNRGDRTVRFPVVMAGSGASLFSLAHIQPLFSQ